MDSIEAGELKNTIFDPNPRFGISADVEKGSKNSSQPRTPPGKLKILVGILILNRAGAQKRPPKSASTEGGGPASPQKGPSNVKNHVFNENLQIPA